MRTGEQIDHKNRNPADNSLENLRIADQSSNMHNRKAKGYHWVKSFSRWFARIHHQGRTRSLGLFREESDAREAYLKAKNELGVLHPNK
jgi:hypothetical protein